eukprot:scaffold436_cov267-Pinguiococcus_pyrenoidosus.AAC.23
MEQLLPELGLGVQLVKHLLLGDVVRVVPIHHLKQFCSQLFIEGHAVRLGDVVHQGRILVTALSAAQRALAPGRRSGTWQKRMRLVCAHHATLDNERVRADIADLDVFILRRNYKAVGSALRGNAPEHANRVASRGAARYLNRGDCSQPLRSEKRRAQTSGSRAEQAARGARPLLCTRS